MAAKEDARLLRLSAICAGLPEVERAIHGRHADFRVRKKVFAYFLDDHHGDGVVSVCAKTELGENVDRVHADPVLYFLPAYIGPKGWVGMRLDVGTIDWRMVENLVKLSYCLAAPKRLAAAVFGPIAR
jgi:hypothetical protein